MKYTLSMFDVPVSTHVYDRVKTHVATLANEDEGSSFSISGENISI